MSSPLALSVVSHGHGALLHRLLHQLAGCPALRGAPVVVTLNLGDEPFDASAFEPLALTVVRNPSPRGFGANHNAAFRRCDADAFAVLNPDLALDGDEPFSALARRLKAQPKPGLAAPRVVSPDGAVEDSVRANLTPWSLLRRHLLGDRRAVDPASSRFAWVAGMCIVVDAEAWREVGGFDERFFLYCEDYDLCARLHLAGRAVECVPSARVVHDARRDSRRSARHLRWHLASLLRVWTSAAFWRVTLRGR